MIREAKPADFPALQAIYSEAQAKNFYWLSEEEKAALDFKADSEGEKIWVAIEASEIVGFASVWEPESFIHHLFVHPSHIRKKVGTKLLKFVLTKIGRPATLKCVSQNASALSFYKSHGWVTSSVGTDGSLKYENLQKNHI